MALWPQLRSPPFALLIVTLAFALVRARDQPGLNVSFGSTTASIVPGDILLAALACVAVWTIVRTGLPAGSAAAALSAGAFGLLVLGTAAANGSTAFVAGAKLIELTVLGLGAAVFVRTRDRLEAIVDVLIIFTIAADLVGVVRFVTNGGRQASFLGEHDFAALATLPLLYGLIRLFTGGARTRTVVAIVAGSVGCVLGAALGEPARAVSRGGSAPRRRRCAAVVDVARRRCTCRRRRGRDGRDARHPRRRPRLSAVVVRQAGIPAGPVRRQLEPAAVYAYVGGRVFLAHPMLGTGW